MIDVVISFDVEDVYFDPREGGDDHPVWIAQTLTRHGLRGVFFYVGDKVRRLAANGRSDVAAAMAGHDIAQHTNSNRHPIMPEYVAAAPDWQEGLRRVREDEQAFTRDFTDFFGRGPDAVSEHHVSGSTQLLRVAAERGVVAFYGLPACARSIADLCFCCGALCTPWWTSNPGFVGVGFDRAYADDARTDACLDQLDEKIRQCKATGVGFLNLLAGHPFLMRSDSPIFNYFLWPNGQNLTREQADALGTPPLKPASVLPAVQRNLARVCRFLAEHPDVNVIGVRELQQRWGAQPERITREKVQAYFAAMAGTRGNHPHNYLGDFPVIAGISPAECAAVAAAMLLEHADSGAMPGDVARPDVLGPTDVPLVCPELGSVSPDGVLDVARQVAGAVAERTHLPGNAVVDGKRIGLGSVLRLFEDAFALLSDRKPVGRIPLPRTVPRYPGVAREIDALWRSLLLEDGVMDPEVNTEQFCRDARLQSWTLKLAERTA